ncbi:hypothetical protein CC86DRAFT_94318 [Ophiobolus disseminans]|uniref:Uncharacterized protein n=1 Tax=Ophiobolus disseminans TaxID=1469910 RepID=A0A6A6ZNL9_9PLEO|nr:hypothetical protein CC86DRAFT_94318 [Ophiobolus disseminans]
MRVGADHFALLLVAGYGATKDYPLDYRLKQYRNVLQSERERQVFHRASRLKHTNANGRDPASKHVAVVRQSGNTSMPQSYIQPVCSTHVDMYKHQVDPL